MYGIYDLVTGLVQPYHGVGEEIPSGSLYSGLENTTTDQSVSTPLPSEGVLTVDSNTHLLSAPWCGDQLELWPLPTDQSAAG